jgi:hypothetical protein
MACLLWENTFYESGVDIAQRIADLVPLVPKEKVFDMAVEARKMMKIRHAPLLVVREMAKHDSHKTVVDRLLPLIIDRADELAEFLAIYWNRPAQIPTKQTAAQIHGRKREPLSAKVKKGLAKAFQKFDAYQIAKYNRDGQVKLRDVMFLVCPKPKDEEQGAIWKKLADGTLGPPDTWEVSLSTGKEKKETWERLLKENKLGALALLRNLRNMQQTGVSEDLVFQGLEKMRVERVLPYRFITAARYAPQWEPQLEKAMFKCMEGMEKIPGKTVLLVDVSGSMDSPISGKTEVHRMDAACGIAVLGREMCEECLVYTFSDDCVLIPARRGFALRDAIIRSQHHSGTYLGKALNYMKFKADRIIVFTDEQAHDSVGDPPFPKGYMVNVASYQNGVGYGRWNHIDGFSEATLRYIQEFEKAGLYKGGD